MRKFYTILGLAVLATISSCTIKEELVAQDQQPVSFYGTMEAAVSEGPTKAYVNESYYGFWNKNDLLSIFYGNTYNKKYMYIGSSGTTSGRFDPVGDDGINAGVTVQSPYNYAIYPYDDYNACQESDGMLIVPFPKERTIKSFPDGMGASIMMVAKSETTKLPFKHVAGYLGFQFYGENVTVASITLESRNNEPFSGSANVVFDENDKLQVSFVDRDHEDNPTCTFYYDPPVALDASADSPKTFWITLPPTVLEKGLKVTVKDANGGVWVKESSFKEVKINTFQRFNPLEVVPEIPEIHVTSVDLAPVSLIMNPGDAETLTATVSPSDATDKSVTWSTSDNQVATVENGVVTALAVGTATITVTTTDGGKTATCAVTVKEKVIPVTSVSLDKEAFDLFVGDAAVALVATVSPDNATDKSVTWSSSNQNVATVDANGNVTAVGPGSATITVTTVDGNKTATCNVNVKVHVTTVSLDQGTLELVVGGDPVTLTATVSPDNATDKSVSWSSSNQNVATVDANGKVTPVAAGTTTITVTTTDSGKTATCAVTVKKITYSLAITPAEGDEVNVGESCEFKLKLITKTNDVVSNEKDITTEATWTSDKPDYATVGEKTGIAVGVKELLDATVTITAKYTPEGSSEELEISVPLKVNKDPNHPGDPIPIGDENV